MKSDHLIKSRSAKHVVTRELLIREENKRKFLKRLDAEINQLFQLMYIVLRGMLTPIIFIGVIFVLDMVLKDPSSMFMLLADYVCYCIVSMLSKDIKQELILEKVPVPDTANIEPEYILGLIKSIKNLFKDN